MTPPPGITNHHHVAPILEIERERERPDPGGHGKPVKAYGMTSVPEERGTPRRLPEWNRGRDGIPAGTPRGPTSGGRTGLGCASRAGRGCGRDIRVSYATSRASTDACGRRVRTWFCSAFACLAVRMAETGRKVHEGKIPATPQRTDNEREQILPGIATESVTGLGSQC